MTDHSKRLIDMALEEDLGSGDVTSRYLIPANCRASAFVAVRSAGIVSGIDIAVRVFLAVDDSLEVEALIPDGNRVGVGALLIRIEGSARSILAAERTALNFLQRLSGIATLTGAYVERVRGTQAAVLDTRKTIPGYRLLEKAAVLHGGGTNHRFGLFDRLMAKDNHLAAIAGKGLQSSIDAAKSERPEVIIELEADNLDQVREFLMLEGVDCILLDNMTPAEITSAIRMRGERTVPQFEASGGVNLESIHEIALTGVEFISVGAITHSAPALDIGLDFEILP